MIWLILGLIVSVIVSICVFCNGWYDFGEKLLFSFIAIIATSCCSLIILLLTSLIVSFNADVSYNLVSDTSIIALKDNLNTNGNLYIVSGYVNEELYYYYAIETELGYKTEKISSEHAYLKYTNNEAHIEKYRGEFMNDRLEFWACPVYDDRYIIYCPEGTVTNDFNIDLE